jgi:hypothetical protein
VKEVIQTKALVGQADPEFQWKEEQSQTGQEVERNYLHQFEQAQEEAVLN